MIALPQTHNPLAQQPIQTLAGSIGDKAEGVLTRLLTRKNVAAAAFGAADLAQIVTALVGAAELYIDDPKKVSALELALKTLAR
jgi:hypothetical protein